MKRAIALLAVLALSAALFGCAGNGTADPSTPVSETDSTNMASVTEQTPSEPARLYEGEIPEELFGIFDEESYENAAFGVKYQRDGSWSFYTSQELDALNGSAGEIKTDVLRHDGFAYDMYARSGAETLGFALAIPSVQFGSAMTEEEYAQAVKEASARDYAGADYDVISAEVDTIQYGSAEHACFHLTVAANGMVFYTARVFISHGAFIGVIYVSAESEESMTSLLNSFVGA